MEAGARAGGSEGDPGGGPSAVKVERVLVGHAVPFGRPGARSAIGKRPLEGPVEVGPAGLLLDEQGDPRHHGGPEKAIHHYAFDHYSYWRSQLAPVSPSCLEAAGAFGENLSTLGLTEADMCVGDAWRLGTVLLQVSQARQPCWKLNHRFGVADMVLRVQTSGRTGWYYRVLEPGWIAPGDTLALVDRPHPDWPLARLLRAFYVDRMNRAALEGIKALELLSPSWRNVAARRLERGEVEDWTRRLEGPAQEEGRASR